MPLPARRIVLTADERDVLERWAAATGPVALRSRARIVLASEGGRSAAGVAGELGVAASSVWKWRARFLAERLAGLLDAPRSGARRRIEDARVRELLDVALHEPPPDGTRWTTRALARATELSQSSVSRICRAEGLLADRRAAPLPPPVPVFEETDCDLAGVFLSPPERMFAFCREPAAPTSPRPRTVPPVEMRCQVLRLLDEAEAAQRAPAPPRECAVAVWKFLDTVDRKVPSRFEVHLLVDRGTLRLPGVSRWVKDRPRFHTAFLPAGKAWHEVLDRWCCRLLASPVHPGIRRRPRELRAALEAHVATSSGAFAWTSRAGAARPSAT